MNIIESVKDWAKRIAESGEEKRFTQCVQHLKYYGVPKGEAFETARTIMMAANFASAAGRPPEDVFEELIHIYGLTLLSGKIREVELKKLLSLFDIHKFIYVPSYMGPADLLRVFKSIIKAYEGKHV
jgi:hypothetical protein